MTKSIDEKRSDALEQIGSKTSSVAAMFGRQEAFDRRRDALCAPLREEAAQLFTRWLALPLSLQAYPDEPPVRAEEILLTNSGPSWIAVVDREDLEDLGGSDPDVDDGSPVDALIRLVVWLEAELAEGARPQEAP